MILMFSALPQSLSLHIFMLSLCQSLCHSGVQIAPFDETLAPWDCLYRDANKPVFSRHFCSCVNQRTGEMELMNLFPGTV